MTERYIHPLPPDEYEAVLRAVKSMIDVLPLEILPFGFITDNIEAIVPPDATVL